MPKSSTTSLCRNRTLSHVDRAQIRALVRARGVFTDQTIQSIYRINPRAFRRARDNNLKGEHKADLSKDHTLLDAQFLDVLARADLNSVRRYVNEYIQHQDDERMGQGKKVAIPRKRRIAQDSDYEGESSASDEDHIDHSSSPVKRARLGRMVKQQVNRVSKSTTDVTFDDESELSEPPPTPHPPNKASGSGNRAHVHNTQPLAIPVVIPTSTGLARPSTVAVERDTPSAGPSNSSHRDQPGPSSSAPAHSSTSSSRQPSTSRIEIRPKAEVISDDDIVEMKPVPTALGDFLAGLRLSHLLLTLMNLGIKTPQHIQQMQGLSEDGLTKLVKRIGVTTPMTEFDIIVFTDGVRRWQG